MGEPRTMRCQDCGAQIVYVGVGRHPKRCDPCKGKESAARARRLRVERASPHANPQPVRPPDDPPPEAA